MKSNSLIITDNQGLHDAIKSSLEKCLPNYFNDSNLSKTKNPTNLISTEELANVLKVNSQTITRWRKKNRIPYLKIGKSYRYDYNLVIQELSKKKGAQI